MPQRIEAAGLDQRIDRALVEHCEIDPIDEVLERGEGTTLLPLIDDQLHDGLTDVTHRRHSEGDVTGDGREVDVRAVHVGNEDPQPHLTTLVQVERGAVLVALDRGQQGCHVLGRMVRFQPCGLVRHQRVRRRMRSVETVSGEVLDEPEELLRLELVDAVRDTAGDELLLLGVHDRGDLLAHGLAQLIRFGH